MRLFYAALGLVTVLLLMPLGWLSSWAPSAEEASWIALPLDKLVHAALFAALFVIGARSATGLRRATLLVLLTAYGAGLEMAQSLVPFRGSEWWDLVADVAGCLAALAALSIRDQVVQRSLQH